jgi:surface protein
VKTATSGDIAAETSTRVASIAAVSGAIAASFTSLQTSNDAVRSNVSALSAALAPKATTTYLDGKIATLLSGAPAQLNTIAEMAAALGNNPSFASSITAALSAKGTAADASTVSLAIATKGDLAQLTSLATVVSTKANNAALTTTTSGIISLNNVVNALSTAVSTLRTSGGSVNGTTVAVSGVGILSLASRIQELYYKLGTANPSWGIINADGTVNYKVNRLANPTLVSSTLAFEYGANDVVTKVKHMVTVQFDKDQTRATVTGTPTPITMVLNAINQYQHTFAIEYVGGLSFYDANKTEASIVALDSAYKLAPLVPTVVASAPLLPFLQLSANNETITYTGAAANVGSSEPLFFQANPRGNRSTGVEWFAVVNQSMKGVISSYADGTSVPFKPPGQSEPVPFNNIITTLMNDMSNLFMNKTTFNGIISSWDTVAVTNMASMFSGASAFNQPIGTWNTGAVANMASMFSGASAFNQPIGSWNTGAVTQMTAMFSGASAFNRPIGTWNTVAVTNMDSMFFGASAFNQPIDTWNITNVTPPTNFNTGSGLTAANPTLVSGTLAFEYGANDVVTKVKHMVTVQFDSAQTSASVTGGAGNPAPTATVNNMVLNASNHYTFAIEYVGDAAYYSTNKTEAIIVALDSAYKLAPLVPTVVAPVLDAATFGQAQPTIVANSMTVTNSGSTYTYTATFTNADNAVMEVLNPDNTVAAVQPTINTPYTHTYDSSKIGSPIFKIRVKKTATKMPSAFLIINGADIPPVLSNFTLGARAIGNSAIVLPQPTSTATVTYTADTYNQVGGRFLFTNAQHSALRISPDGTKVAIGGISGDTRGIVRVYSLNSSTNTWSQLGGDILGSGVNQQAGMAHSYTTGFNVISMSADATMVATVESGLGNIYTTKRVNVFKYDPLKTVAQPNSGAANFGPVNWSRVSTFALALNQTQPSIALSADGTTLAIVGETLLARVSPPYNENVPTLRIYRSTDGGITWAQRGLTLSDSPNGYDGRTMSISANGLQVVVTTMWFLDTDNAIGQTPSKAIVYEWNGSAWVSTILRELYGNPPYNSDGFRSATISYDGKVVVTTKYANDVSGVTRSHKNENGTWTNNAYTFNIGDIVWRVKLSADGSIVLITRPRNLAFNPNGNDIGIVEIYRWNGTEYVAVIGNNSIKNRSNYWADTDFDAMLSADGTRLIVGHNAENADVYELVATNKFSYSTSNSAVAEVHGNLALLKSAGSSTITATQTATAGNATIASELTVVSRGIVSSGTLLQTSSFGGYGNDNNGFYLPTAVAIDATGNMVIVDMLNARVKVHSTTNNQFLSKFGTNGSGDGQFLVTGGQGPRGVATFMNGNIAVADTANNRVQVFSNTGVFIRKFGSSGSGDSQFNDHRGIAVNHRNNNILVADMNNHRIQVFSETGTFIRTFGVFGTGNGEFRNPTDVATDMNGTIYVADSTNNRIQVFSETGTLIRTFGSLGAGDGQFNRPYSIATDAVGKIIVVDSNNNRIQVFQNDGTYVTKFSSGVNQPEFVAVNAIGNIVLVNPNSIFRIG